MEKYYLCVGDIYFVNVPKEEFFECVDYISCIFTIRKFDLESQNRVLYSYEDHCDLVSIGFIERG